MTIRIQGRSVADGNIGKVTDFTQIEADEGRIFETLDDSNNLSTWVVESTNKGGNQIAGGLYANPINSSPVIPKPILSIPFGINQTEEFLNGSVSCVRSTVKNYTDIYGSLRVAPVNTLAIEKDGALIEGAATNLAVQSNNFLSSSWNKVGVGSVTNGGAASRNGSPSFRVDDQDSSADAYYIDQSTSIQQDSSVFTFHIDVKRGNSSECTVALFLSGGNFKAQFATLNFDNETIDNATNASFEKVGEWYRLKIREQNDGTNNVLIFRFYPATSQPNTTGYTDVAFAQAESGDDSSYIETTTAPATRAADVVTIPALNNYLGQNEGDHTIYIKASTKSQRARILNSKSTAGQNFKYFFQIDNDRGEFTNGSISTTNTPTTTVGNLNSYALTFNGVESLAYVNGVGGVADLSPADSELDTASLLTIGSRDSGAGDNMYGHVKDFKLFDVSLNANQIKGLG